MIIPTLQKNTITERQYITIYVRVICRVLYTTMAYCMMMMYYYHTIPTATIELYIIQNF